MKKNILPFSWLPASWGLRGDAYAIAEANYEYEGEELERALAAIQYRNNPKALARQLIEIDFRYERISAYVYEHRVAEADILDPKLLAIRKLEIEVNNERITPYEAARAKVNFTIEPGVERDIALLDVDFQFNRIKKPEYEKQRASLKQEPWVAIVNSGFNLEEGIDGVFFEFDWNSKWIEFLKLNGYVGHTDEQIVEDWFADVCRSHNPAERLPIDD